MPDVFHNTQATPVCLTADPLGDVSPAPFYSAHS
jgi:hypothetical protein